MQPLRCTQNIMIVQLITSNHIIFDNNNMLRRQTPSSGGGSGGRYQLLWCGYVKQGINMYANTVSMRKISACSAIPVLISNITG